MAGKNSVPPVIRPKPILRQANWHRRLELFEEAQVVLEEQADVGYAVLAHGQPLDAEVERQMIRVLMDRGPGAERPCHNRPNLGTRQKPTQFMQVFLQDSPDNLKINAEIFMDNPVPQPNDLKPFYL